MLTTFVTASHDARRGDRIVSRLKLQNFYWTKRNLSRKWSFVRGSHDVGRSGTRNHVTSYRVV